MPWPTSQSIDHPVGINVYGSTVIRTDPDRAVAEVAVTRIATTPKAAFSDTGKGVDAVRKSLQRNDVPNESVEVSRVSLASAYEGYGQTQKFVGYRARVGFRIILDKLESVERVLIEAVEAGATEVTSVKYLTTKLRELRAQCRREAVAAARHKAEVYCEAAGVSLGHVLHIEDVNPDSMFHQGGHAEMSVPDAEEEATAGALKSGSLVVSAAAIVTWSLLHD